LLAPRKPVFRILLFVDCASSFSTVQLNEVFFYWGAFRSVSHYYASHSSMVCRVGEGYLLSLGFELLPSVVDLIDCRSYLLFSCGNPHRSWRLPFFFPPKLGCLFPFSIGHGEFDVRAWPAVFFPFFLMSLLFSLSSVSIFFPR